MKVKVEVTYSYEIEVDEKNSIVKEYDNTTELVSDLVHYRFDILPVINDGVVIKDWEVQDFDYYQL